MLDSNQIPLGAPIHFLWENINKIRKTDLTRHNNRNLEKTYHRYWFWKWCRFLRTMFGYEINLRSIVAIFINAVEFNVIRVCSFLNEKKVNSIIGLLVNGLINSMYREKHPQSTVRYQAFCMQLICISFCIQLICILLNVYYEL